MGLASILGPAKADGAIIFQLSTSEVGNDKTAPIAIENNDSGVSYSSLKLDSGIANLLWQAYGVADLYNNDFSSFLNSGLFGYNISSGSQVQGGWSSSVNPDGTVSINNVGGTPSLDYAPFDTGKTMTGNFFANKSLLDADNDGNANYTLHLLSDAQTMPNFSSPLTKTGIVGAHLNGNFAEAYAGAGIAPASGQAYALVPTEHHPAIPEPSTYASVLGALALAGVMYRRRRASGGKIVRSA